MEPDPGLGAALITALQSRNWLLVSALCLILTVYFVRTYGGEWVPFLKTDRGGAVVSLVGAFAITLAKLAAGAVDWKSALIEALILTATASGTYTLLKKLISPSDKEKEGMLP